MTDIYFIADNSGSMEEGGNLSIVKETLKEICSNENMNNCQIAFFDNNDIKILPLTEDVISSIKAERKSPLGKCFESLNNLPNNDNKNLFVLFSDGFPTDFDMGNGKSLIEQNAEDLLKWQPLKNLQNKSNSFFLAMQIGENPNLEFFKAFTKGDEKNILREYETENLIGKIISIKGE